MTNNDNNIIKRNSFIFHSGMKIIATQQRPGFSQKFWISTSTMREQLILFLICGDYKNFDYIIIKYR